MADRLGDSERNGALKLGTQPLSLVSAIRLTGGQQGGGGQTERRTVKTKTTNTPSGRKTVPTKPSGGQSL